MRGNIEDWTMFIGTRCRNPARCKSWWLRPSKVHYHEDFNGCDGQNDIAILEHYENIPTFMATPICLPEKDLELQSNISAAGNGMSGRMFYRISPISRR
ncbi:hypothetical protein COOONC_19758 [Cooperia oncophora]